MELIGSNNVLTPQRTLEKEARQCQALVIWTDCDREGENIGFEIIDVCKAGDLLFFIVVGVLLVVLFLAMCDVLTSVLFFPSQDKHSSIPCPVL